MDKASFGALYSLALRERHSFHQKNVIFFTFLPFDIKKYFALKKNDADG